MKQLHSMLASLYRPWSHWLGSRPTISKALMCAKVDNEEYNGQHDLPKEFVPTEEVDCRVQFVASQQIGDRLVVQSFLFQLLCVFFTQCQPRLVRRCKHTHTHIHTRLHINNSRKFFTIPHHSSFLSGFRVLWYYLIKTLWTNLGLMTRKLGIINTRLLST